MRMIDFARTRNFNIKDLLEYELSSTSFFLSKDGFLRKSQKSDLLTQVKKRVHCPSIVRVEEGKYQMIIIDFMSFARKVPIKRLNLKIFSGFVANLWSSFNSLSRDCTRIDIVFFLYKDDNIKAGERSRRGGSLSNFSCSAKSAITCWYW